MPNPAEAPEVINAPEDCVEWVNAHCAQLTFEGREFFMMRSPTSEWWRLYLEGRELMRLRDTHNIEHNFYRALAYRVVALPRTDERLENQALLGEGSHE